MNSNTDVRRFDGDPSDRLESWKAIAAYLNRGVTTLQRWEREEGLPVHRLQHDALGSVYAFKQELEAWRGTRAARAEIERGLDQTRSRDCGVAVRYNAEQSLRRVTKQLRWRH